MTLLTPENVAAARAARSARIEHWKANASQLKQDFADEAHWRRLASRFGVRMPSASLVLICAMLLVGALRTCTSLIPIGLPSRLSA